MPYYDGWQLPSQEITDAYNANQQDPLNPYYISGTGEIGEAPLYSSIPTTGYTQQDIDAVVNLINSGQASVEEVAAYFGVDPGVVQENLDYINRTHHDTTTAPATDPVPVTDQTTVQQATHDPTSPDYPTNKGVSSIVDYSVQPDGTIAPDGSVTGTTGTQDPGDASPGDTGTSDGTNQGGSTSGPGSDSSGSDGSYGSPGTDAGSNDGGDWNPVDWLLGGISNIIPGIDPTNFGGDNGMDFDDITDWLGGIIGSQGGAGGTGIATQILQNNILERSADEQQDINRDAAIYGFGLSNPDQYGPYGNVIWENRPPGSPAPRVTTNLTPEQQALFDANQARQTGMAQLAGDQLGRVGGAFGQEFDPSLTPFYNVDGEGIYDYMDPGQLGHDQTFQALQALDQPYRDQQQQALNADLAARGFNPQTEGAQFQQMQLADQFGRRDLQHRLQAQQMHRGMVADTARTRGQQVDERLQFGRHQGDQRAREFQEALTRRQLPLNELNALATGSQFQMPQFQDFTGTEMAPANAWGPNQARADMFGDIAGSAWERWGRMGGNPTTANVPTSAGVFNKTPIGWP